MVESTALEMRRAGNRTVGSNPTLSANFPTHRLTKAATPERLTFESGTIRSLDSHAVPIRDVCRPHFCPLANTLEGGVQSLINVAIKQVLSIFAIRPL